MPKLSNPANKTVVVCKECSQEFPVRCSLVKRGRGKFCSSSCYKSFWVKNYASPMGKKGIEMRRRNKKKKSSHQKHFWL